MFGIEPEPGLSGVEAGPESVFAVVPVVVFTKPLRLVLGGLVAVVLPAVVVVLVIISAG